MSLSNVFVFQVVIHACFIVIESVLIEQVLLVYIDSALRIHNSKRRTMRFNCEVVGKTVVSEIQHFFRSFPLQFGFDVYSLQILFVIGIFINFSILWFQCIDPVWLIILHIGELVLAIIDFVKIEKFVNDFCIQCFVFREIFDWDTVAFLLSWVLALNFFELDNFFIVRLVNWNTIDLNSCLIIC